MQQQNRFAWSPIFRLSSSAGAVYYLLYNIGYIHIELDRIWVNKAFFSHNIFRLSFSSVEVKNRNKSALDPTSHTHRYRKRVWRMISQWRQLERPELPHHIPARSILLENINSTIYLPKRQKKNCTIIIIFYNNSNNNLVEKEAKIVSKEMSAEIKTYLPHVHCSRLLVLNLSQCVGESRSMI